ncbi:MAG: DNA topoisomerase (ATP-hydrolyzing) subunit B [archaeon]|nr:DNA topoisomerase (ATP-hydrolyzing) subunit B [archaeon]
MSNKNTAENSYGAADIVVLEGLEAVRKRPSMYVGSTDTRGLHHLVYEVVDNSIDEVMAGYANQIHVKINADGSCVVKDNGRGIPTGMHEKGKSALELVLTELHAGGKFNKNSYKVSGGLHGVGISVVNGLSTALEAVVERDGHIYRQTYHKGIPDGPVEIIGITDKTGTKITFNPDPEIFESTNFDYDTLKNRFRNQAFLNKQVTISFEDERSGNAETFHYEGGVSEFVQYLNRTKTPVHPVPIYLNGQYKYKDADGANSIDIKIAMQWTEEYSENIVSFVNTISTPDGGTHLTGFKTALTKCFNEFAKDKAYTKGITLEGSDIREGLTAVINIKIPEPQFEGQTKSKLGNSIAQVAVLSFVMPKLSEFLLENPKIGNIILKKAVSAFTAREAACKAREAAKRKSVFDSNSLPGKLADCSEKDPSKCELYIVEGDSAGGSAKQGRDRVFQAILPIRGKILNVEKVRVDKILESEEIRNLAIAIGGGVGPEFDVSKIRYNNIIIMTDADVDGAHIGTLLLTLFYRQMKPLIEEGHVFLAMPPLYRIAKGKKEIYAYNDAELGTAISQLGSGCNISRYKGLGEMNPHQLWETTMNPSKRLMKKIKITDAQLADSLFSILMGDAVEPRREYIVEHAHEVVNLDV